jgi:uncharacterized membrane protein
MAKKRRRNVPAKPQPQQQPQGGRILAARQLIEQYSGPIPPPEHLRGYEEVLPGAAERILAGFERQAAHRQALETKVTGAAVRAQTRGAWLGFVVAVVFLAAAVYLILRGYTWQGTVLGSVDIVGLVSVFVIGKREQRKERQDKLRLMYGS